MVDLPSRATGVKGLAWAGVITPIVIAVVSVGVLWGTFGNRISNIETEQARLETTQNNLSGVIVELRIAVATLTNQVATLNSQLHDRDAPQPMR